MNDDLKGVLVWLARNETDSETNAVSAEDLADGMDISIPRARHYMRELEGENLVWKDSDSYAYGLTADGDEYIVEHGLDE